MSTAEIKSGIDRMSDEERFFTAAYLHHLAQNGDAAYQAMLADRLKQMDAGKKVTREQLLRVQQALETKVL
jgi:hypothetical protein